MSALQLALLVLMNCVCAGRLLAGPEHHGRVETGLAVASPRLGHDIAYAIYLPPDQQRRAPRHSIVLYLLHGRDDNERAWIDKGEIAATLDRLIISGVIPPVVVVMPMAGNSWYVDDARGLRGFGPFASAIATDFIPAVERRHGLEPCRQQRAIGGHSMGGYGAMLQALLYADLYGSAFSLSGSLFSDRDDEIAARMPFYRRIMPGIFGEPLDAEAFKRWTVFDRLKNAQPSFAKLHVWLAAGERDFPSILTGTVRLHVELRQRKIDTSLRIYDGGHDWATWHAALGPALLWLASHAVCTNDP